MLFEPLFEHHQHPHHRSVVIGVALDVHRCKLIDELRAHEAPLLEVSQTVERGAQVANLVATADTAPTRQITPRHGRGGEAQFLEWTSDVQSQACAGAQREPRFE